MANPDYVKPELQALLPTYKLCQDCYDGERAIKNVAAYRSGGHYNGGSGSSDIAYSPYLPDPSPESEDSAIRARRYRDYLQRAVFYNVTRRTVSALVGQIFSKYPTYDLNELAYLESDVDGAGQSLVQQAKDVAVQCLLKGGGGLLADIPVNDGVTKASMATGGVRPFIAHYERESIINWRVSRVGAVYKLSLLVLSETYIKDDDGFKQELGEQLLILRLVDGQAESEVMQNTDSGWVSLGANVLRDNAGKPLAEIPFYFYGAVNNDAEPDLPPMLDIASLNVAHFRNSADLEELLHISSQPTLVVSGLSQDWVNDILEGGISIGARSGILLPQGGVAQMMQISADSVIANAMADKEAQMKALGAKLIQESSRNKTATEAAQDNADETSVLSTISNNLSDCFTKAVRACGRYIGVETDGLFVTMNTQFDFAKLSPEQIEKLMSLWQVGAITFAEFRAQLVESEYANIESYQEAAEIIKQEQGNLMTQDVE